MFHPVAALWTRGLMAMFLVSSLSCKHAVSSDQSQVKITNGRLASAKQFPSIVLVKVMGEMSDTCTGTFVGANVVLTAAHCLDLNQKNGGAPAGDLVVLIGGAKGERVIPSRVFFPKWAGYSNLRVDGQDLAVILLNANKAPAVTPIKTSPLEVGAQTILAGYGLLTTESKRPNDDAPEANSHLNLYFGSNFIWDFNQDHIFSVGEETSNGRSPSGMQVGTSSGDSGGPLFVSGLLAGTVSWGPPFVLEPKHFDAIAKSRPSKVPSNATMEQDAWAELRQVKNLAAIRQRVERGEKINLSAYINITASKHIQWLKSLAKYGVRIQFEGDGK